jgi:ubiquinone/menaquinone biosynthesis C-methylase UbiE
MNFDSIAAIYDDTRVFDDDCFNAALNFITARFPPSTHKKLFEPGIGTGRIAIPFAERGYDVTGVDISDEMLEKLAEKLKHQPSLPVAFQKADVTRLPFSDDTFDIAVAVHVFHLIRDWKIAMEEVFRVLRLDAPLVFLYTGTGSEIPDIKTRYRELCAERGFPARHIGMRTASELDDYVAGIGRRIERFQDRWRWTSRVPVDMALADMKSRFYSCTNLVPDDVHLEAIRKLERELTEQYGNLAVEVDVSLQIALAFVLPASIEVI